MKPTVFIPEGGKPQSIRIGRGGKVEKGKGFSPKGTYGYVDSKGPIIYISDLIKQKKKDRDGD